MVDGLQAFATLDMRAGRIARVSVPDPSGAVVLLRPYREVPLGGRVF